LKSGDRQIWAGTHERLHGLWKNYMLKYSLVLVEVQTNKLLNWRVNFQLNLKKQILDLDQFQQAVPGIFYLQVKKASFLSSRQFI